MRNRLARKVLAATLAGVMVTVLGSCTVATDKEPEPVDIGLLAPLTGSLKQVSADSIDAFKLYLKENGGKLGGRKVNLKIRDEGESKKTSIPSVKKFINEDKVDCIIGVVSSATYVEVAPLTTKEKIPLIGYGGQPDLSKSGLDFEYLWQSTMISSQPGNALAPYVEKEVDGSVFAVGPDYPGGYALLNAFTKPFLKEGGELANETNEPEWTPWPKAKDFSPVFEKAVDSGAKAIYADYLGAQSIQFVKEYAKSEASHLPLYGAILTEGPALAALGKDAEGVHSAMNYSPDIDNAANRRFVKKWGVIHPESQTSMFSMAGWDGALVLDQAIAKIDREKEVTRASLNKAMGDLGTIDSPRGQWKFTKDTHTPIQKWYLRVVAADGPILSNVVVEDLATLGD